MKKDIESSGPWVEPVKVAECEEVDENRPHNGVGCVDGCLRDKHFAITIFIIVLIAVPFLWVLGFLLDLHFIVIQTILGVLYVSFCLKSNSFQYIRSVVTTEDIVTFMGRMYKTKPAVYFSIRCYHYETRTRTKFQDGRSTTETYQAKVYTHSARDSLKFVGWQDTSTSLNLSEIEKYVMTKVSVKKRWTGDAGADEQRRDFVNKNNRDTYYVFSEDLQLEGYRPRFLGFPNLDDVPCLAHWKWYVLSHLTVVFALPYRMWLSSRTGKVRTEVVKQIWTSSESKPLEVKE